jgi:hypothetical protein
MARTKNSLRKGWAAEFIARWKEAADAGLTRREFVDLYDDLTYGMVATRVHALEARGIHLPALRHGNEGNRHNATGRNQWSGKASKRKSGQAKLMPPLTGEVVAAPAQRSVEVSSMPRFTIEERPGSSYSITITIGG